MQKIIENKTLVQTTIYYRFYLFNAMNKAGMGELYLDQLNPWKEMIEKGLTTWEEGDYDERSDCHAWGSSPNYHLLSIVGGINPGAPGFSEVNIAPHLGNLKQVSVSMPHPNGTIKIAYQHEPGDALIAAIHLPAGTKGQITWGGQTLSISPGHQTVKLICSN
jgi:hypothetical protein